jgi:hypothetical protein
MGSIYPLPDDLEGKLKLQFTEFNRNNPVSKTRRVPEDLKELIRQAGLQGIKRTEICRISGLAPTTVHRYLSSLVSDNKLPVSRRLTVVGSAQEVNLGLAKIRLCSGVTIELEACALSQELLGSLNALGGGHVAAR